MTPRDYNRKRAAKYHFALYAMLQSPDKDTTDVYEIYLPHRLITVTSYYQNAARSKSPSPISEAEADRQIEYWIRERNYRRLR